MPLLRIPGVSAFDNTRHNPFNTWPSRNDLDNRVEPIAKPAFSPTFKIETDDNVFTIGSCFARNVEIELEKLGFSVPMRNVRITDEASPVGDSNVFNNYSVPSILNELQWATDPAHPFDKETGLLEVSRNKYCDLHLTRLLKPSTLEEAMTRRERIAEGMRSVTRCRVVIITLGLVEVWWDHQAQRYLNIAPPKQAAKSQPDRFELHVLSYEEIIDYLHKTVALLDRVCIPGYRIVLTVSPVPLGMTFTTQDVMVANSYSKSALRAATQEIYHSYGHVDYFPSYESIVLSDRQEAFQADLRHVTGRMIATNVNRMIEAYTAVDRHGEAILAQAQAAEKSRNLTLASELYQEVLTKKRGSAVAKLGLARCLAETEQEIEAISILDTLIDDPEVQVDAARAVAVVCRRSMFPKEFERAQAVLEAAGDGVSLRELILTTFERTDFSAAKRYCDMLTKLSARSPIPAQYLGRIALAEGDLPGAEAFLRQALSLNQSMPQVFSLLGQLCLRSGRISEAEDLFSRALALNPRTKDAVDGMDEIRLARAVSEAPAA